MRALRFFALREVVFLPLLFTGVSCRLCWEAYWPIECKPVGFTKQQVDDIPLLVMWLARDKGLCDLLRQYGEKVRVLLGPDDEASAFCMYGGFDDGIPTSGPIPVCFRLDIQPELHQAFRTRPDISMRIIVQWPFAFDVVATCYVVPGF